jgi:hypothetical protein
MNAKMQLNRITERADFRPARIDQNRSKYELTLTNPSAPPQVQTMGRTTPRQHVFGLFGL